jgi:hypothetical protein
MRSTRTLRDPVWFTQQCTNNTKLLAIHNICVKTEQISLLGWRRDVIPPMRFACSTCGTRQEDTRVHSCAELRPTISLWFYKSSLPGMFSTFPVTPWVQSVFHDIPYNQPIREAATARTRPSTEPSVVRSFSSRKFSVGPWVPPSGYRAGFPGVKRPVVKLITHSH